MRNEVELLFNQNLIKIFGSKPEILKFVLEHERKQLCIDNTCEQIQKCERAKFSISFNAAKYHWLIKNCAKLFARAAVMHAEEQALSQAEKNRRIAHEDLEKEASLYIKDLEQEAFRGADEFERADIQKQKAQEERRLIREDARAERLYKSGSSGLVGIDGKKLKA